MDKKILLYMNPIDPQEHSFVSLDETDFDPNYSGWLRKKAKNVSGPG